MIYSEAQVDLGVERLDASLTRLSGKGIDSGVESSELQVYDAQRVRFDQLVTSGVTITGVLAKQMNDAGYGVYDGMKMVSVLPPHAEQDKMALSGRKVLVAKPLQRADGAVEQCLFPAVVSLDTSGRGLFKVISINSRYGLVYGSDGVTRRGLTPDQRMLLDALVESEAPSIGSHHRAGFEGKPMISDFEHIMPEMQGVVDSSIGAHAGHTMRSSVETGSVISSLSGVTQKTALLPLGMPTKFIAPEEPFVFFYDEGLELNASATERPLDMQEGALRRIQGLAAFALGGSLDVLEAKLHS